MAWSRLAIWRRSAGPAWGGDDGAGAALSPPGGGRGTGARVAGADEVRVQGVDGAVVRHGADGGDERLPRHLAAEDAGGALRRADAAEEVDLQLLQVEQPDQPVEHGLAARHAVGVGIGNG